MKEGADHIIVRTFRKLSSTRQKKLPNGTSMLFTNNAQIYVDGGHARMRKTISWSLRPSRWWMNRAPNAIPRGFAGAPMLGFIWGMYISSNSPHGIRKEKFTP
jgi:hypothetical protein